MLALGHLDHTGAAPGQLIKLLKQLLELLRRATLQRRAPARRHQEEHLPKHDAQLFDQFRNRIEVTGIPSAEDRVRLQRHSGFANP